MPTALLTARFVESVKPTAKQVDYNWNRQSDGALSGNTQLQQADGFAGAWGEVIATKETIASAGSLTGHIDAGAAQTTS